MALRAYADEWLAALKATGHPSTTIRAYSQDLVAFLAGPAAGEATPWPDRGAVLGWLEAGLGAGLAPATVRRRLASFRAFARWLRDSGRLPTASGHPGLTSYIPAPKVLAECLEERQMEALLVAAEQRGAPWAPLAIRLLYDCGLRAEEACAVRPTDIQHDDGALRIHGKGAKERLVPASPELLAEIHARGGIGVRANAVRVELARIGALVSLPHIHPHLLRASAATHALRRGASLRGIQLFLGHSSLTTTQRYLRLGLEDVREAIGLRR